MSRREGTVAALGSAALLQGYRLAGALLYPAAGAADVRAAWFRLPDSVAVVLLTPDAAGHLVVERENPLSPLTMVLPS
ncbi:MULTISPECIES: hypothetical protein [unclassified Arthrobacter]|uniref:hypothetical protein n=1 Tax=unclassified Arthrobacter TaxID=235627 RepID=UPI001D1341C6|nr:MULTISPECIES: hypothetical protein [unclassified Arthrobacter]MCC3274459.1 hypothetical protein [Arthrobacter sp. zg-Y20]MCC3279548.1 hypothetical protein [Arthrobacter sp. zg-Y40]MCC9177948.1 hypothetical protein [Arthrobacter sp. zg-Y750]MDK1314616.1 hypothetical protein [Arthrobacter sp. zg.Y20]MDK1327501.1 hypothetical protein [Arthrobacter sp. zg-Y1143]